MSPISKSPITALAAKNCKPSPKTLFSSQKKICNRVTRSSSKKEQTRKEYTKSKIGDKKDANLTDKNLFLEGRLHNAVHDSLDKGREKVLSTNFTIPEQHKEKAEVQMSVENKAVDEIQATSEDRNSSNDGSESTRTIESSSSDDDFSETRNNIKKLKESLASKRERFFNGNDSFQVSNAEKSE